MEPVTHILTGACLARTGLNRRAAYTTLTMAVAAELPDIDTLWGTRGPIAGFEHHRGITHTFLGIPFEAAAVLAAVYCLHRWRRRRAALTTPVPGHAPIQRPLTAAPVRWGLLYAFTILALLSHLFLDYTNNYGLRPFFPFNPRWYAASITFIFDPLMFAMLLAALVLPSIFRLVSSEVGARRQPFAAPGWAIAALLGVVGLWTLREVQHNHAIQLALGQSTAVPAPPQPLNCPDPCAPDDTTPAYLQAQRALANPDPLNPFRWWMVTDFGPFYQLGQANTRNATVTLSQVSNFKLNPSPAFLAAESSRLGRVYLDWSPMPFVSISNRAGTDDLDASGDPLAPGHTLVTFSDPRFMGDTLLLHSSGRPPLTGAVELDAQNHVVAETMDGKPQH